ncbi:MAG TPA: hypothetical protein VGC05_18500, partial [Mycobacterium sp.]
MSSQVMEYVVSPMLRWRLAAGIAAFVVTRTAWFYVAFGVLFLWAAVSMVVRLLDRDNSWWVDPVIFIGAVSGTFLVLAGYCFARQGNSSGFRSGQPIRAT